VLRPFFSHFPLVFLSLLFSNSRFSLFSHSSSPTRRTVVGGGRKVPTRWPASHRGGATASELKTPFFLKFFYFSYVFYPPDSVFELRISKKIAYDCRSKVERNGDILLFFSPCVSVLALLSCLWCWSRLCCITMLCCVGFETWKKDNDYGCVVLRCCVVLVLFWVYVTGVM